MCEQAHVPVMFVCALPTCVCGGVLPPLCEYLNPHLLAVRMDPGARVVGITLELARAVWLC